MTSRRNKEVERKARATDRKMKLQKISSKSQYKDKDIMAGLKFKMQYLGCREELIFGGTDQEIADVIHDIHTLYTGRSNKLSRAQNVVVFVDADKLHILDKNEKDILATFPLVYVKDVTMCLDHTPYSNTIVLVAKQHSDRTYKAFVLYSKTSQLAMELYHFTTRAFQLGFKRMQLLESESLNSISTAVEASSSDSTRSNSFRVPNESKNDPREMDGHSLCGFEKTSHELQKLLDEDALTVKDDVQQTVTVRLSDNESNSDRQERERKFNLKIGESSSFSKTNVFMKTAGESSRFFVPHWFRNSYSKFRKVSSRPSVGETSAS